MTRRKTTPINPVTDQPFEEAVPGPVTVAEGAEIPAENPAVKREAHLIEVYKNILSMLNEAKLTVEETERLSALTIIDFIAQSSPSEEKIFEYFKSRYAQWAGEAVMKRMRMVEMSRAQQG